MKFLEGKKTFIVVAAFAVLAAVSLVFKFPVPEWGYAVLAALGLAGLRSAITHLSGNKGWKTYVAVVATVVLSVLNALGVSLPYEIIYTVLGALGVVGVRDAMKEVVPVL